MLPLYSHLYVHICIFGSCSADGEAVLILSTVDIWGWLILCCDGLSLHCRMGSRSPGPLEASSTPCIPTTVATKNDFGHCQMSPMVGVPNARAVTGLLGNRMHSRRWAAGKRAKLHLCLQPLPGASITASAPPRIIRH
uniref:Uncharacterized protein n=1 Tax=Rousettus aegyptiacus TaxID=9407 RepID=A0A7J8C2J9_ROUAE|nr:hypothetical protein HJG63_009394 [Rousettus aegyptiacus]